MVRLATSTDIDALCALVEQEHGRVRRSVPIDQHSVRTALGAYIQHADAEIFVDHDGAVLVGMVSCELAACWSNFQAMEARAHIFIVSPQYRGLGHGTALVSAVEYWAKHRRARGLSIGADVGPGLVEIENLVTSRDYLEHEVWWRKELA